MPDAEFLKAITTNRTWKRTFFMQGGGMSVTMKKRLTAA